MAVHTTENSDSTTSGTNNEFDLNSIDINSICPNCATIMKKVKIFSKKLYKCPRCGFSKFIEDD